jgi:hypothetical protein
MHVGETFITDVILLRINLSLANLEEYKASITPLNGIFSNELIEAAIRNMAHGVLDGLPLLNGHPLKLRLELRFQTRGGLGLFSCLRVFAPSHCD